jgi:hypothetical protein
MANSAAEEPIDELKTTAEHPERATDAVTYDVEPGVSQAQFNQAVNAILNNPDVLKQTAEVSSPEDALVQAVASEMLTGMAKAIDQRIAEVNSQATVAAKVKPFVFDPVSGVFTINDKHGTFQGTLMGIDARTSWVLTAHGLHALLRGRMDKEKALENIKAGQFGGKKRKRYPATVLAWARVEGITIDQAYINWQQLSNEDRMIVRSMPKVRVQLGLLAEEQERASETKA